MVRRTACTNTGGTFVFGQAKLAPLVGLGVSVHSLPGTRTIL